MSEIHVREGESLENALKRFKRSCAKSGVLAEVRKREYQPQRQAPQEERGRPQEPQKVLLREKQRSALGGTLFFASGYFDGKGVGAGTAGWGLTGRR